MLLQFPVCTIDLREKSRFSPLYYSYRQRLREVRCFRRKKDSRPELLALTLSARHPPHPPPPRPPRAPSHHPDTQRMLAACILIIATLASMVESYVSQSSMSASRTQRALGASSSQSPGGGVDRDMMSTYDALAARLIDRYEKEDAAFDILRNNQLFVCVAGGPGSGKSTLSTAVAARINEQLRTGGGATKIPRRWSCRWMDSTIRARK